MAKPNKPTLRIAKLEFTGIAMARQSNPPNSCRLWLPGFWQQTMDSSAPGKPSYIQS